MIGLEYICKKYNVQFKDIANKLNIKPQTINTWLKGIRKIPQARLEELSALDEFKGIPKSYFQKELTEYEELQVQQIQLNKSIEVYIISETIINENNVLEEVTTAYSDTAEIEEVNMKIRNIETRERLKKLISELDLENTDVLSYLADIIDLANRKIIDSYDLRQIVVEHLPIRSK